MLQNSLKEPPNHTERKPMFVNDATAAIGSSGESSAVDDAAKNTPSPVTFSLDNKPQMEARVFGKWILVGEHSVLRGAPALVFPVFSRSFHIQYFAKDCELNAHFAGSRGEEIRMLFWGVFDRAMEIIKRPRHEARGMFEITHTIPVGAGMGASAALCVGLGRWFLWKGWIKEESLYEFCRELENLFHGESSGVDVAVALLGEGLFFKRDGARRKINAEWQPKWFLSYSGKRGLTSECITKVKKLISDAPDFGLRIDDSMKLAAVNAEKALLTSAEKGISLLAQSIEQAAKCFKDWGLVSQELENHILLLKQNGALAVKPTGSGDGGFVLSLWDKLPPENIEVTIGTELISVFDREPKV